MPTELVESPLSKTVVRGDSAEFSCVFEHQPTITWFHNDIEIEPDYRVWVTEESTDDGSMLRSTLSIHVADIPDCGSYSCSATLIDCDPVTGTAELEVNSKCNKVVNYCYNTEDIEYQDIPLKIPYFPICASQQLTLRSWLIGNFYPWERLALHYNDHAYIAYNNS